VSREVSCSNIKLLIWRTPESSAMTRHHSCPQRSQAGFLSILERQILRERLKELVSIRGGFFLSTSMPRAEIFEARASGFLDEGALSQISLGPT